MKLTCAFFIVIICLCYGCEKTRTTTPSTALSYPYTDTFYGVFNDTIHDNVNSIYGVHRDTSFPAVCYVSHVTASIVDIKELVSRYSDFFTSNSGIFNVFPFEIRFEYDSMRTYSFHESMIEYYVDSVYVFKSDSFYTMNYMSGVVNEEVASFAGKGHVH